VPLYSEEGELWPIGHSGSWIPGNWSHGILGIVGHYVDPGSRLGNITETPIEQLLVAERQHAFGMAKRDSLPEYCQSCEVPFACRGECPKNRFATTPDGEAGLNYLCAGYKHFFGHIDRPTRLVLDLLQSGRLANEVMPILAAADEAFAAAISSAGRNGPCPCGSGRKTKQCHDAPATTRDAIPVTITPAPPRPRVG
jgi:uncharacterized protein